MSALYVVDHKSGLLKVGVTIHDDPSSRCLAYGQASRLLFTAVVPERLRWKAEKAALRQIQRHAVRRRWVSEWWAKHHPLEWFERDSAESARAAVAGAAAGARLREALGDA